MLEALFMLRTKGNFEYLPVSGVRYSICMSGVQEQVKYGSSFRGSSIKLYCQLLIIAIF
jgi:hypothetical protein